MKSGKIKLRPYQADTIKKINATESGAVLVCMATGLGKTVTFANIARRGRVLILAHRKELIEQPRKYYGCSYGVELNTTHSHGEDVVAASVQTLQGERLQEFAEANSFDMVITDEAHHAVAKSYRAIVDAIKPRLHVGFTATPNRADGTGLGEVFSRVIADYPIDWAIREGYLCDIHAEEIMCSYSLRNVRQTAGDFSLDDLGAELCHADALSQVAKVINERSQGQTVVFATTRAHAAALTELVPGSHFISGETKKQEREQLLADFAAKKYRVLINCAVLTEGTDIPCIETIVLARPTKSSALYTQMVGRGLRLCEGKERLLLLDCQGAAESCELCTPCSLIGLDESEVQRVRGRGATSSIASIKDFRAEAAKLLANDNPQGWLALYRDVDVLKHGAAAKVSKRLKVVPAADGSLHVCGITISAPDVLGHVTVTPSWGVQYNCVDIAEATSMVEGWLSSDHVAEPLWRPNSTGKKWENDPATERQYNFLRDLGINLDEVGDLTKGEASYLIDNQKRKNAAAKSSTRRNYRR